MNRHLKSSPQAFFIRVLTSIAALVFIPEFVFAQPATKLNDAEATAIASEAYVYGYPLVTMEMTRRVMTNTVEPQYPHAPMGQFYHARAYPDAAFRDVTAPNADTLYSIAWLDLSKEPFVLSLPNEDGRYFLMPILSGWTDVFAVPGKRTTGTEAQKYVIAGPNWTGKLPDGVKQLKSPTDLVWILGRTYCTGTPEDYKAVHALQAKYELMPLSAYGKPYTPPKGTVNPKIDMKTPVRDQVNRMSGGEYFSLLAKLMKDDPPAKADGPMVARMAKIGLTPGKDFDADKLDPAVAKAVAETPQASVKKIMGNVKQAGKMVNGWVVTANTGKYGTDYLQRATVTAIGLGANLPQDAVYPVAEVDGDGKPLLDSRTSRVPFFLPHLPIVTLRRAA